VVVFGLEYAARLWSVVGHSPRKLSPSRDRIEYALSSLGIIDLLAFLPASIALIAGRRSTLVLLGMLPFLKLVRYSPAMRSLLSALHAERRTLIGCIVILTGAVLLFASLLYHRARRSARQVRHHSPRDVVGDRDAGHGRLRRCRARDAARQAGVGVHHRRRIDDDRAAGGDHLDCICRRGAAARFRGHLGMLARVPLFSHLGAAEIADIMRLLRAIPSSRARSWYGAAMPRPRCISSPRARSRSSCQPSASGFRTARSWRNRAVHRTKRSGTVTATRKTKLLALDAQDFHALIERVPDLAAMFTGPRRRGLPIPRRRRRAISPPVKSRKPRTRTAPPAAEVWSTWIEAQRRRLNGNQAEQGDGQEQNYRTPVQTARSTTNAAKLN